MNFFLIRQPSPNSPEDRVGRSDAIPVDDTQYGDPTYCQMCSRPTSMREWLPPFRVNLDSWGTRYADVANVGETLIVSDHFQKWFHTNGLKGLHGFTPIEVAKINHRRKKPLETFPQYFIASVTRSITRIDQQASGYVWKDPDKVCPECLFDTLIRHERLIVDLESWIGDDIFYPRGGNGPLVSERFKTAWDEARLAGIIFIPSEQVGYSVFPWQTD